MWSHDLLAESQSLPKHEVERLLAAATKRSRSAIVLGLEVSDADARVFRSYVRRREADEPLQYIEGDVPFGPITVEVDRRVLVPRPETEYLFELVAHRVENPAVIVDLCTGSGNLAIALKATFPRAAVHATDLSEDAIAVAEQNAERNGLDVSFLHGDLFGPLPEHLHGTVDLLVSNPPYLADSELDDLPADVLREPRDALVAGEIGDEVLERIGTNVSRWLAPGGMVACEVSEFHARTVVRYFRDIEMDVVKDLSGRDRFVMGVLPVE
jgi:release factor glutamine methyltransferase